MLNRLSLWVVWMGRLSDESSKDGKVKRSGDVSLFHVPVEVGFHLKS
jgi:hypothetical protein